MRGNERQDSLRIAQKKYSEAGLWWAAFDGAIHKYRVWALIYVACKREIDGRNKVFPGDVLPKLRIQFDAAHDGMLAAMENMYTCARAATASEMAGRIYYEEFEERETSR